jgi:hypothetical protein
MNTRVIVWSAVGVFWSGVVVLAVLASRAPPDSRPKAATAAGRGGPESDSQIDDVGIARHAAPDDCWIRVGAGVYDVSRYVPQHPTAPHIITDYCGKDATWAFETKARGRPHSARAYRMLEEYRVGTCEP